jgi:virginiamycin B lyase
MTAGGDITLYATGTTGARISDIAQATDGSLWFTENGDNKIGTITQDGIVTHYDLPTSNAGPIDITAGADGSLWFTESIGAIGTFTITSKPLDPVDPPVASTPGAPNTGSKLSFNSANVGTILVVALILSSAIIGSIKHLLLSRNV